MNNKKSSTYKEWICPKCGVVHSAYWGQCLKCGAILNPILTQRRVRKE